MHIRILEILEYMPAILGWQNSRDHSPVDFEMLACVDAPVNELPTALLEFVNFTIIEREIFTSARNHVIWARTSRVDDPMLFTVPEEFHDQRVHGKAKERMHADKKIMSQDQWRMHLPLVSHTSWTARMSYRDLVKMQKYFNYLAKHDHIVNKLRYRFKDVAVALHEAISRFLEGKWELVAKVSAEMKLVKYLNENPIEYGHYSNEHFKIIEATIPIALRAQLVRHREVHFVDNFFKNFDDPLFMNKTIGNTVKIQVMAKHEVWRSIIGKRACWIAQADLWQPIVDNFAQGALPCVDGHCPYEVDAEARLHEGKDPNPPCPRYCNLKGVDKTPFRLRMQDALKAYNGDAYDYWTREIAQ